MNAGFLASEWPRRMQMWSLALAVYIGCKLFATFTLIYALAATR